MRIQKIMDKMKKKLEQKEEMKNPKGITVSWI